MMAYPHTETIIFPNLNDYDLAAYKEVVEYAYDMLADRPLARGELIVARNKTEQVIGESGVCDEASDAVTRAAHLLGFAATREYHEAGLHYITAFVPVDQHPTEDDPIACLTWGQFSPESYAGRPGAFIGIRRDMAELISDVDYQEAFSAASVSLRQITHTPAIAPYTEHVWLSTSHEDLATGRYPVGEVSSSEFDIQAWEFPGRLL